MRPGEAEDLDRLRLWTKETTDKTSAHNLRTVVLPRMLDEYERMFVVINEIGAQ